MAFNNVINAPIPFSVGNGGTGATTLTANGFLFGAGTSAITASTLAAGEIFYGVDGDAPTKVTLAAGANVNISLVGSALTFSAAGGVSWQPAPTSATMVAGEGYVTTGSSLVTLTLPASATFGDYIWVSDNGTTGRARIAQNAGQSIRCGNETSTVGVGGTVTTTARGDAIYLICVDDTAGAEVWQQIAGFGQLNVQ